MKYSKYIWLIVIVSLFFTTINLSKVKADKEPNNNLKEAELIFDRVNFGSVDIDDLVDFYKIKVMNNTMIIMEFSTTCGAASISLIINNEEIRSSKSHIDTVKLTYFAKNETTVYINITCITNYTTDLYLTNYELITSFEYLPDESVSNTAIIAVIIVIILLVIGIFIVVLDLKKRKKLKNEKSKEFDNMLDSGEGMYDNFQNSPLEMIEKLGELKDKGYITKEEFQTKKEELLKRA